jgi:hypothetical protein
LTTHQAFFFRTELGTISGKIYLDLDGGSFPEKDWYDMVVPFAEAWLHAVVNVIRGKARRERVMFFEGPFFAVLSLEENGSIGIDLGQRTLKGETTLWHIQADLVSLLENALGTAKLVIDECNRRGWSSSDISRLTELSSLARDQR